MTECPPWRVLTATVNTLEAHLNELAAAGYEVFTILPLGSPEPLSQVPRQFKSLEQRTTCTVVARRADFTLSEEPESNGSTMVAAQQRGG